MQFANAGQGSRDQAGTRRLAYSDPALFHAIIDRIEELPQHFTPPRNAGPVDAR